MDGAMLKRFIKGIIGLFLLPVCAAETIAFAHILKVLPQIGWPQAFFLAGIAAYTICFFLSFKLNFLYVFGHEAVHAVITLLCGGRVTSFHVSTKGGSVSTTKSNFIISLGPYFIPLYTVLVSLVFFFLRFAVKDIYRFTNLYLLAVGFTIAFHFFMTIDTLRVEQPDLSSNGYLFSLTLIFLINVFILAVLLSLTFPNIHFGEFVSVFWSGARSIGLFLWAKGSTLAGHLSARGR